MKYRIKLNRKEEVAEGTMSFYFEKPEGLSYTAGQFLDWRLLNPPETDAEGDIRAFSILQGSDKNEIGFATRMRDTAFKRTLKNKENVEMEIDGPMGSFILHKNIDRPAVFLIGGIGITPVFSILQDASENKTPHKLYLFYSNRTEKDAPFIKELQALEKMNSNFIFIPTLSNVEGESSWKGETGYISKEMISRHIIDTTNAIFYITGPQSMVLTMRKLLDEMGVSEDDIKTEEFSGY